MNKLIGDVAGYGARAAHSDSNFSCAALVCARRVPSPNASKPNRCTPHVVCLRVRTAGRNLTSDPADYVGRVVRIPCAAWAAQNLADQEAIYGYVDDCTPPRRRGTY
eukprot:7383394-Prymnesium_polylepis.1